MIHVDQRGRALIQPYVVAAGFHTCELCADFRRSGEIFVPSETVLYVAPVMIDHYVRAHRYLPPREFIDAVLAIPTPDSDEYRSLGAAFVPRLERYYEV